MEQRARGKQAGTVEWEAVRAASMVRSGECYLKADHESIIKGVSSSALTALHQFAIGLCMRDFRFAVSRVPTAGLVSSRASSRHLLMT